MARFQTKRWAAKTRTGAASPQACRAGGSAPITNRVGKLVITKTGSTNIPKPLQPFGIQVHRRVVEIIDRRRKRLYPVVCHEPEGEQFRDQKQAVGQKQPGRKVDKKACHCRRRDRQPRALPLPRDGTRHHSGAGCRVQDAGQHLEGGGFAGAVRPQQADGLTALHRKADAADGVLGFGFPVQQVAHGAAQAGGFDGIGKVFAQLIDRNDRHGSHPFGTSIAPIVARRTTITRGEDQKSGTRGRACCARKPKPPAAALRG